MAFLRGWVLLVALWSDKLQRMVCYRITSPSFWTKTRAHIFRQRTLISESDIRLESSWIVMAHGDARQGKWRGNWRMEWVASTFHTTSKHGVSSLTTADAHTSAASSRMNWRPRRFKWTRPFRRKTKSGFCACAIIFQSQSTRLICIEEFCLLLDLLHNLIRFTLYYAM